MSKVCLHCFNKIHNSNYKKKDVVLSGWDEEDLGLCQNCGKKKELVLYIKRKDFFTWLYKV